MYKKNKCRFNLKKIDLNFVSFTQNETIYILVENIGSKVAQWKRAGFINPEVGGSKPPFAANILYRQLIAITLTGNKKNKIPQVLCQNSRNKIYKFVF